MDQFSPTAGLITKVVLLALTFLLLHTFPKQEVAYAGENIWTWTGVSGSVHQIVTDPLKPSIVYARMDTNRIVKSTDSGTTWVDIADPTWTAVYKIAMAYATPDVLYATTSSGIYRADDGGSHWQLLSTTVAEAIAVSPVDWQEAYIVGSTISKTVDGGLTWQASGNGLPSNYPPLDDIVIAPSAPHILIAKPFNMTVGPLYKSTNRGETWSPIGGSYLRAPNFVTFDPKNSNVIYLGTFLPGGWKSTDGGDHWLPLANGLEPNGFGFVIDPDNTQVVHAANLNAGVLESLDGGASWTPMNTGIQGLVVMNMAIASRQPLVVYAGMPVAGIWKMTRTTIQDFGITINDATLFTNQTAVTLTITAPPGTTQMQISNDGGFGGVTWEAFKPTKPWTITAHGSYVIPRIVYAKFKTNGQTSGLYQDDIVLDQTQPTGTIQITNTLTNTVSLLTSATHYTPTRLTATAAHTIALPLIAKNHILGLRLVGLSLSVTDDVSGVDSMLISNEATFTGAQWQGYAQRLNWYVNEKEITTVYIKYRDRAGNESPVYTAIATTS